MASRLSSLLVRDGLVGVKRMERAFQRQVIYGGSLDTILLEMKLVPEERLLQYLSLATGLPPATRAETSTVDPEAAKLCTMEVALAYEVVPLSIAEGALRVLVRDPVQLPRLEDLASELDVAIQPLVVPEYRYHVVFARTFNRQPEARFVTLARLAEESSPTVPVGKAATVIVSAGDSRAEPEPEPADVAPPKPKAKKTLAFSTDALARHLEQTEAQRKAAEQRRGHTSRPVSAPAEAAVAVAERPTEPSAAQVVAPEMVAEAPPDDAAPETEIDAAPTTQFQAATPPEAMEAPDEMSGPASQVSQISAATARAQLEAAEDRDFIFSVLLRAIRSRAWYAGLLTVQGGAAIGRIAIAGDQLQRDEIAQVLIPLDTPSAFAKVVKTASPYIGPIATGDSEIDQMIARMGGVLPPAALLLPVALRNRVVAIAVGHRGGDSIGPAEVSQLLPLAGAAASSLSRLIMKSKAVGYRSVDEARKEAPEVDIDEPMPDRKGNRTTQKWGVPQKSEPAPDLDFAAEVEIEADEPDDYESIDAVLDLIEDGEGGEREAAIAEALRRTDETLHALTTRFPGKLNVDRYELGGRAMRAARHGPLLDLVIRLGAVTADLLIERMNDSRREARYYATLCASELRPRSALTSLVERLFDADRGIRSAAIDALSGYPARELDISLEIVRHALHSDDLDRLQAASDAVANLADIKAIPDLLEAAARGNKGAEYARRALVLLTKQDFGTNSRKWKSWWKKHQNSNRIEWLIEALGHKDEQLRQAAAEDLRKLTGEYFGYQHDLSKKEREQARKKWEQWWNETGRRRFLRADPDERHRPTALLPVRRE